MTNNNNPVLSDGTRITDLVDLEHREVKMRTLSDPELYNCVFRRT